MSPRAVICLEILVDSVNQTIYILDVFCYLSFLRLSYILRHTKGTYDPTKQLYRGDLIFSSETITVILKWSKTLQNMKDTTTICIYALGGSPLCPFKTIKSMLVTVPGLPMILCFKSPRGRLSCPSWTLWSGSI